jgi:predicted nucleic acid-binding protein
LRLVLDASVIVQALVGDGGEEPVERASALWLLAATGRLPVVQPPHWLAEVCGVLGRVSPDTVVEDTRDLHVISLPMDGSVDVYARAAELALALEHHVFDTLYHAVALGGGMLVTADEKYYRKAAHVGSIVRLADFTLDAAESGP